MNGLVGRKAGMTQVFSDDGDEVPVTILEMGPCFVTQVKTGEVDGYSAVQLGFDPFTKKNPEKMAKPQRVMFEKRNLKPQKVLREVKLAPGQEEPKIGDEIKVDIFQDVSHVSVTAISKGRGFAGVVKRHGFSGAPMSHGAHEQFRHPGSVGMHSMPGRVLKGKKLPGQMGNERVTILNLSVVRLFPERNLMLVRGAVPGPNGGLVMVTKSSRAKIRVKQAEPAKKGKK
ncbi:MAG: 50S ribosomal protein L3 [Nitrospinota bacterium]|nr:50S ribosomal protein L3 [Nitrospinota bacterium]MDH5757094.1 50S ribosomal protein L3 [Nitrospinota bacterium]